MLCCPTILDQAEGTRRPIYKAEEMPMSQSVTGWFCRKIMFLHLRIYRISTFVPYGQNYYKMLSIDI